MNRRAAIYAAFAAGVVLASLGPISDGDIYWHLAAGREILRTHAVPQVDPFTTSAAGRPWIDVHWLFQVVVSSIERLGGMVAIAVAKAAVLTIGGLALVRSAERAAGPLARDLAAVSLLGLLFLGRHLVPARPTVASLLFVAIFFAILESHRRNPRRSLMALPFWQVLWSNCQGLAPLGIALVSAYLVGQLVTLRFGRAHGSGGMTGDAAPSAPRSLAVALVLCVAASFITPYGVAGATLPLRLLTRITPGGGDDLFSREIVENIPPFLLERAAPELIAHFKWVLIGLGVALAALRPRIHPAHVLVLLAFGGLALMASRNVILFYWVLAPISAVAFAPPLMARYRRVRQRPWFPAGQWSRLSASLLVIVVGGEVTVAAVALAREAPVGSPSPFHFPVESARRLAAMNARGPIFAPDQHGGFLEWTVPALRPYLDTRLVLHTADEYRDYLAVLDDPERFKALDSAVGFRYVLLSTAYPDRYLALLASIAADPHWHLIFTDGYEALFSREGPPLDLADRNSVEAIASELTARFHDNPTLLATAQVHLARALIVLGHPRVAERMLTRVDSRAASQLRARARFAAGDVAAAESLARVLAEEDPSDRGALTLLAEITLATGRRSEALGYIGAALTSAPYDPRARAILAQLTGEGSNTPR
jgi:hypothetical protein